MYELYEIWLHARQQETALLDRIRVYVEPDTRIGSPMERSDNAVYWLEQYEPLNERVRKYGINVIGNEDRIALGLMQKYAYEIGNILTAVADVLRPRSIDGLLDHVLGPSDPDGC